MWFKPYILFLFSRPIKLLFYACQFVILHDARSFRSGNHTFPWTTTQEPLTDVSAAAYLDCIFSCLSSSAQQQCTLPNDPNSSHRYKRTSRTVRTSASPIPAHPFPNHLRNVVNISAIANVGCGRICAPQVSVWQSPVLVFVAKVERTECRCRKKPAH